METLYRLISYCGASIALGLAMVAVAALTLRACAG